MSKTEVEIDIWLPQECFTHQNIDEGTTRTFLIGTMKEYLKKYPEHAKSMRVLLPITQEIATYCVTNQGIEPERISRLCDPYLSEPGIAIAWPDNEFTIVDGNHRLVKLFQMGHTHLKAYLFKYPFWENFLLDPETQEMIFKYSNPLTDPSGILEYERNRAKK